MIICGKLQIYYSPIFFLAGKGANLGVFLSKSVNYFKTIFCAFGTGDAKEPSWFHDSRGLNPSSMVLDKAGSNPLNLFI